MKVVVFGATGGIGRKVVEQALARGHQVTAFVRQAAPDGLAGGVTLVQGDVLDASRVSEAVSGQEAVIVALGSKDLCDTKTRSDGTRRVIDAMTSAGVRRIVAVSAMGIGDSWSTLSWFNRLFFATLLRASRIDHEAQEAVIRSSGLDWTILRPSALTDEPGRGDYQIGENIRGVSVKVPREDVARALLDVLDSDAPVGRALTVTY